MGEQVNHSELWEKIESFRVVPFDPLIDSLQAVVKLHKPDVRGNCDICSWVSGGFVVYSVCPTINAIEGALQ